MRKLLTSLVIIVLCITVASCCLAGGFSSDADAIEMAAKSVLKIYVYESIFDEEPFATGSGFVAFDSSTLITNYHVIDDARLVIASDDDDNTYELDKVLCADKDSDIAILRFSEPTKLKALELYPDDQLKRGSPVVAIGSPKGLKNTVSTGIVSYQYVMDGIPEIQITAPISPGSSGGALFNDEGKVIGVTSAIYKSKDEYGENTDAQNLNFAVNIAVAQAMYNAWDGKESTIRNHKSTAKMDFTDVYKHGNKASSDLSDKTESSHSSSSTEKWTCPNCGMENSTKYCQECGNEKPYWICSCGVINSSNKFCGECGKNHTQILEAFNLAIEKESENDYEEAIRIFTELGLYDSGSYETNAGIHAEAKSRISKCYYEQGIYLQKNDGDHESIIKAFTMAGDYLDAKDQIKGEEARFMKSHYDKGLELLNNGDYDEAIAAFINAGDYPGVDEQIKATYYAKGLHLLEEQDYLNSRETLNKVKDYLDAKTLIKRSYYEEAEAALANGETENAKKLFSIAGDYKDAKVRIASIEEKEKDEIYIAAIEALNNKQYENAKELFAKISGFRDADEMIVNVKVMELQSAYDDININYEKITTRERGTLDNLRTKLAPYKNNINGLELYKKICYAIARYYQNGNSIDDAITYYQKADNFLDSAERLVNMKEKKIDQLVEQGSIKIAINDYSEGFEQYELIKPGSKGNHVEQVLQYIKLLGIKTKGKIETNFYKEEYIPYVQEIEEYFGLYKDGHITIDEYIRLSNCICEGHSSEKVKKIMEKLADLSYIQKLPDIHNTYEKKYTNSIKKAEKELGLQEDGIITGNEYDTIISLTAIKPDKPSNVKVTIKDDNVTITWSKSTDAITYDVWRDSKLLGTTAQTKWVDKRVKTGMLHSYKVIAKKYTVESEPAQVVEFVSVYYKPISVSVLNVSKKFYTGDYVKLNGLKIDSWTIDTGNGEYQNSLIAKSLAQNKDNCDVYLLCYSGNSYVEVVLENYKGWDWTSKTEDLLGIINRITTISVQGTVNEGYAEWGYLKEVPSVTINNISWYYQ